jgi:uncharacterized pyridoxal phosphate-containing UPF0001 family protein
MLSLPQNCSQAVSDVQIRIAAAAREAGRNVDSVTLLAVSKGQSAAAIDAAARAGIEDFGENFLQECLPKIAELAGRELTWHFIGRLQANKTRPIAENFAWVHGGEASKGGVDAAQMRSLAQAVAALPHLKLRGLMCMPPAEAEVERQRQWFRETRQVFGYLNEHGFGLDTLSMGTSADFEAAIAEGSTLVRVGTAIFGPRS